MRLCLLIALSIFPIFLANAQQDKPKNSQASPAPDQRGTNDSPFVIKLIPPEKTQQETAQEAQDRTEKTNNDRKISKLTGELVNATYVLAGIGVLQLIIFGYQAIQLRRTVKSSADQSQAMERSIAQAARSATAMEAVAVHIEVSARAATESVLTLKERTAQQMRAYLTVTIGDGMYQERQRDIKFEAKPLVANTGHTPALKVRHTSKADILPMPLPDDFDFHIGKKATGAAIVGAQQTAVINAIVDDFVDDKEVDAIKAGSGRRGLYIWGIVIYEDIFGKEHKTKYCQNITWLSTGKIYGYYISGHNDAD